MKTSFAASFTVALAVAISVIIPSTGFADETHYPVTTKNCGRELTFHKAPLRAFAGGQNSAEVVLPPGTWRQGCWHRQLRPSDLEAVIALDAPRFAVSRPVHLARLFESSLCYGLFRGEGLSAYSMSRAFGRGHLLGPIAAMSVEEAIAVARPHVEARAGRFLRVETHFETGTFASFIQQRGLPIFDMVTTMTLGEGVDHGTAGDDRAALFALASQLIG